jgi:hypothetical protein
MEREQRTDGFTALEDYFSCYEVYDPAPVARSVR